MSMLSIFPSFSTRHPSADQPFSKLRQDIDRIFDDFSGGFRFPATQLGNDIARLVPNIEVQEDDKKITISTELPGIDEQDIDVSITNQILTISGEKKSEVEKKEDGRYLSERSYGKFSRSLTLPFNVEENSIDALYEKGVLTLTLPKPAEDETKTKRVKIKGA